MNRTRIAIAIALTVFAAALGGHQIVRAAASAETASADSRATETRSFVTPRLDGRLLDVRLSAADPAAPGTTAIRFCHTKGFDALVGFSIRAATETRLIGDHSEASGALKAFYAIRCTRGTGNRAEAT